MIIHADETSILRAAAVVRRGGLVAFPTETVYGLGADATNAEAVARIFAAKGRPQFDPLIVHVASTQQACALWAYTPPLAARLIAKFWPGPLTLVLPKTARIPDLVTAGLPTLAVRMPDHRIAQRLLEAAGCPISAPSANRFQRPSPTTAHDVEDELGDAVELILDDGPTRVGIESTILAFEDDQPVLLRPGGVPLEALEEVTGGVIARRSQPGPVTAPGMLARHYAPRTPLYLLEDVVIPTLPASSLAYGRMRVALLSLGPLPAAPAFTHLEVLSKSGDLIEAAARLFQAMRRLDALRLDAIVTVPMPLHGLGLALMDRLQRASSGRATVQAGRLVLVPLHNRVRPTASG